MGWDGRGVEVVLFFIVIGSHFITRNKLLMNRIHPREFGLS